MECICGDPCVSNAKRYQRRGCFIDLLWAWSQHPHLDSLASQTSIVSDATDIPKEKQLGKCWLPRPIIFRVHVVVCRKAVHLPPVNCQCGCSRNLGGLLRWMVGMRGWVMIDTCRLGSTYLLFTISETFAGFWFIVSRVFPSSEMPEMQWRTATHLDEKEQFSKISKVCHTFVACGRLLYIYILHIYIEYSECIRMYSLESFWRVLGP